MMKDQLQWSSAEPEAVSSGLFDTAFVAEINDSMHYLFVSDGQKVAAVCYIGPGYTDEFLKMIQDVYKRQIERVIIWNCMKAKLLS